MIQLTRKLAMKSPFVLLQFVLARKARSMVAPRVSTLVLPFCTMPGRNVTLKVGLSLKRSVMITPLHCATQWSDMNIVDMRLESLACPEKYLASASWPGT
jgi:hypothetical protein